MHSQNVKNIKIFSFVISAIMLFLALSNKGANPDVPYYQIINLTNIAGSFSIIYLAIGLSLSYCQNITLQHFSLWTAVLCGYAFAFLISFISVIGEGGITAIAIIYLIIAVFFSASLLYLIPLVIFNSILFYCVAASVDVIHVEFFDLGIFSIMVLSILTSIVLEKQRWEIFYSRKKLKEKISELNKALDVRATFLGHMSHELRTPLNAIIGFSEMLKNKDLYANNLNKVQEYAEFINSGGNHLLSLVNDLLIHKKIESGDLNLHMENEDILHFLETYIEELRPVSAQKNQKIFLSSSDEKIMIDTDRRYFKQVIYNILSNALRHSPIDGKVEINVTRQGDEQIEIRIIDDGNGISDQIANQIMNCDNPEDTHLIASEDGNGLGLIIVRKLLDHLRAKISIRKLNAVSSEMKTGTEVKLIFPVFFNAA